MIECTCQERPSYVVEEGSAVFAIVQIALYTQTHTCRHVHYNRATERRVCEKILHL